MRMVQLGDLIRVGVLACLALGTPAYAQNSFQLVELLSSEDTVSGYFPARDAPSLSGDTIAFVAVREGGNNSSIVRWQIGADELHIVVTENATLPGGDGRFSSLNDSPSIDGTDVAFHAFTDHPSRAIFAELGGELERLSWLARFGRAPQVNQGRVLYVREHVRPYIEIFLRDSDGTTRTVAQSGDPAPDGSTFRSFGSIPMLEGDRIVFAGSTQLDAGAYRLSLTTGEFEQIISRSTPVPDHDATFGGVVTLDHHEDAIAFYGTWEGGGDGVFIEENGLLTLIADNTTPLPDGSGMFRFSGVNQLALGYDGGALVFQGRNANDDWGLFTYQAGTIRHLLAPGDTLEGRTVLEYRWTSMGLDGNTLVVMVLFTDGVLALYGGTLPACPPDLDGNGEVNTLDILMFLIAWASNDPLADFNGDGLINSLDVLAFLNAWTTGC